MFSLNNKECDYWCKCNYCMFNLHIINQSIFEILDKATPERRLELELYYSHHLRYSQRDKSLILTKCMELILNTPENNFINESLITVIIILKPSRTFLLTYAVDKHCKPLLKWVLTSYSLHTKSKVHMSLLLSRKEYEEEKELYKKYRKRQDYKNYKEIMLIWKSIKKNRNMEIVNNFY